MVGDCGLGLAYALILVCALATSMTAPSLSALSTNGIVKGGIYYFVSRSLGSDVGGTIGTVFLFAMTFGTARLRVRRGSQVSDWQEYNEGWKVGYSNNRDHSSRCAFGHCVRESGVGVHLAENFGCVDCCERDDYFVWMGAAEHSELDDSELER